MAKALKSKNQEPNMTAKHFKPAVAALAIAFIYASTWSARGQTNSEPTPALRALALLIAIGVYYQPFFGSNGVYYQVVQSPI